MADDPSLEDVERSARALNALADDFARSLTAGLAAAVVEGRALEDVLSRVMLRLSDRVLDLALQPVDAALGALATGLVNGLAGSLRTIETGHAAAPAAVGSGEGRVVDSGGGAGARGGGSTVVVNVTARDADSFRRSEAQVSAMLARAVGRGRRGL